MQFNYEIYKNMNSIKRIVFLGASTAFLEVYAIIKAVNAKQPKYEIIAILDDNIETHGKIINGVTVVGSLDLVEKYTDSFFVFGIGSMKTRLIRQRIINKLNIDCSRFETIIHPTAIIDDTAKIGYGCIIHPGVFIANDVVVDNFTVIAVNSVVGPFAHIGSFAMITSLVAILSSVNIGKSVFVGACSCVTENISIGAGSMIGAGTVVSRNIEAGSFFLGNPGRLINKIELPADL